MTRRPPRTPLLMALMALLLLSGCRPAGPAASTAPHSGPGSDPGSDPDTVTLTRLPTLSLGTRGETLTLSAAGPDGATWWLTCDTPAGPLRWNGPANQPVAPRPLPPQAHRCDASLHAPASPDSAAPAGTGTLLLQRTLRLPRPVPPVREVPPVSEVTAATAPATRPGSAVTVASGTVTVTPARLRIGLREPWLLRAGLRGPDGQPVPDGVAVLLTARGAGGETLSATRVTVNGEALWQLTPETPGEFTFTARVIRAEQPDAWRGAARAQAVSALLGAAPQLLWAGDELTLGPLRWVTGALPDDGTPVTLHALSRSGATLWSAVLPVAQGQVRARVPDVRGAVSLRVRFAGQEVRFPWQH
ncbi:hypothetical protein GCM10008959_19660 [Deinococcus seoulensis]|uniref:Carboxypeptidase regulatory-like domain-containing protein n=1 Tax=Deinococcus seoulensis TaxID=1837379 RepID=A0ABQ2RRK2_9DEIO|nr:hypothetical protein [Deinococcus seoulensis]GGR58008.1 hypothetical protein GCM10008959_19660 [Deinococcus seoulensis]